MRHSKLDFNEIVRYIGEDCVYNDYTYLKTGDIVHIERQMTAQKIVVFAMRWNSARYTLKMPRELFQTLPNRPNMWASIWNKNGAPQEILDNIVNIDVRYVIGQML